MPTEIHSHCGMEYFDGKALEEAEWHFFAIEKDEENPDSTLEIPVKRFAA